MKCFHNEDVIATTLSLALMLASAGQTTVDMGPYRTQLRLPAEGLFSGEETDLEFRVTDTRSRDEVEDGFKGVGGIRATAEVSMPSMPGMPNAHPKVHREGVPGDYGIEAYFPHGGQYKIKLTLAFPNAEVHDASFLVNVGDARPSTSARPPYYLKIVGSQGWKAGQTRNLQLRVINSKTGAVQTRFDVAHERRFHLLLVSRDLNWFRHEHPTMDESGTWLLPITFPAGTEYLVFGDVAPTGEGSRILGTRLPVSGQRPTWEKATQVTNRAKDGELEGTLFAKAPIQVGKAGVLGVRLRHRGAPVGDTEPWLGAAGHMMIFHEDGKTVVHSHPKEDETSARLVKQGTIEFGARFPKPGRYKVYMQALWRGKVRTLGFGIQVAQP